VSFYIKKNELQIEQNRTGYAPLQNFTTTATALSVSSAITVFDPTWTDGGTPLPLTLASDATHGYTMLYAEYRAWLQALVGEINGISDPSTLDAAIPGAIDPDNPLKQGVFEALENANGTEVKFIAVGDPSDLDSWSRTLEALNGYDGAYGLVPLTRDRDVLDLFAAHINAESGADNGLWRSGWFNLAGFPSIPIVAAGSDVAGYTDATTSDGEVCTATISVDPATPGTPFILVESANGNFITNNVQPGDIVRAGFTGDGFGDISYSSYILGAVLSENTLRLASGPAAGVSVASKIEVWRELSATEESSVIASTAGSWGSRRIHAVWPDQISSGGTTKEGYFLCAALAGLASGILPQQGMTNLAITGFDNVSRTTKKFNKSQLDTMAASGVWIVTQDPTAGTVYTRHAVTTGSYGDVEQREEMITRNVDSISFLVKSVLAPFIGLSNVTPSTIDLLRLELIGLGERLINESYVSHLGGQVISMNIATLEQDAILKDRILVVLDVTVPAPCNNIVCHVRVLL
jgi:hypothetical protein